MIACKYPIPDGGDEGGQSSGATKEVVRGMAWRCHNGVMQVPVVAGMRAREL